ncbi:hypothetical protein SDC9_195890 [bioreactor metagenome]|uniref:Uncharacterized protein n=1 Tax=bioreactor metagenome TaxID=1076179 RepID=A0A645ILT6_9ZZZZ
MSCASSPPEGPDAPFCVESPSTPAITAPGPFTGSPAEWRVSGLNSKCWSRTESSCGIWTNWMRCWLLAFRPSSWVTSARKSPGWLMSSPIPPKSARWQPNTCFGAASRTSHFAAMAALKAIRPPGRDCARSTLASGFALRVFEFTPTFSNQSQPGIGAGNAERWRNGCAGWTSRSA